MDEVRLWRVARSQADILAHMRDSTGLDNNKVSVFTARTVAFWY